ncbi:alpha-L-iduronidase-like isoform X2 [Stegodyphus dumicola]|uniref:alpha-L-iduronidase-like isoform X2 n=1 Tax=Stegodyphus dumicola TaxID=202533 RepID=UPI0015AF11C5|nr:alpha-L-iduronidase-like isoform X2 [Stegodyphus dumicola]
MLISNFLFALLVSSTVVSGRRRKLWEKNTITTANVCKNHLTYDRSQGICHYQVIVNGGIPSGILEQFWKSSGLCPPDPHQESYKFLLSSDMRQNLFHIGSLPYEAVTQVRIHWMLDLVQIRILPDLKIWYNFSYLDELILILKRNNLQPGFELMGNPSNYFTDFENVTQVYIWRDLVKTLAAHYISFLNYYDACSEGLKLADKRLRFGGPGGSCRIPSVGHSPICWALLNHCLHGKNFFTRETGIRIDFISFHKKGNGSTFTILEEETETINYIKDHFPKLLRVPFYNEYVFEISM